MKKLMFILLMLILANSVSALSADNFVVESSFNVNDSFRDNLYVISDDLVVQEDVLGDLYALSGNILLNGTINDDFVGLTENALIIGNIGGDLRFIGGDLVVSGTVFKEVLTFAESVVFEESADVGGTVWINALRINLNGNYDGSVKIDGENVVLNGVFSDDVYVNARYLSVDENSLFLGDVYLSDNLVIDNSLVKGDVYNFTYEGFLSDFSKYTFGIFEWFLTLVTIFVTGVVFLLVSRDFSSRLNVTLMQRPLYSFLIGLASIILIPVVGFALLFSVVGLPLSFILFAVYGILFLLSGVVGAWYLGGLLIRLFTSEDYKYVKMFLGSIIFMVVILIPILGVLIWVILSIMAFGSFIRNFYGKDKPKRRKKKK
ncbi:hypothetical protein K9L97_02405 [Candidatus Woesearchaeota archaeon]|nr:hypothetical protein [Candidatus Woesearchaeota archaeon]